MRRVLSAALAVLIIVLTFSTIVLAYSGNGGTIVYVTRTGSKYHMSGCSYLKSKISIHLEDAVNQGYTPCSRCDPPDYDRNAGTKKENNYSDIYQEQMNNLKEKLSAAQQKVISIQMKLDEAEEKLKEYESQEQSNVDYYIGLLVAEEEKTKRLTEQLQAEKNIKKAESKPADVQRLNEQLQEQKDLSAKAESKMVDAQRATVYTFIGSGAIVAILFLAFGITLSKAINQKRTIEFLQKTINKITT